MFNTQYSILNWNRRKLNIERLDQDRILTIEIEELFIVFNIEWAYQPLQTLICLIKACILVTYFILKILPNVN